MSSDIIQDKLHVKRHATRCAIYVEWQEIDEIYVKRHCTSEITCQATCYKAEDGKSMSSNIAQMKLGAQDSQLTILREITDGNDRKW